MKKMILTIISILPFSSLSMASTIKLNEMSKEEKISLIIETMKDSNEDIQIEDADDESELDAAIKTLLRNGNILENAKVKKGSGGESVGGGF